jgi:hypothetical protein
MAPQNEKVSSTVGTTARAPKVGHKKSRQGCLACKSRRVKCDETTPECRNCKRLLLDCEYGDRFRYLKPSSAKSSVRSRSSSGSTSTESSSTLPQKLSLGLDPIADNPLSERDDSFGHGVLESRSRRMMELRLLHFWMAKGSQAGADPNAARWRELWFCRLPKVAFEHENLLYGMLALAATQLCAFDDHNPSMTEARQQYWGLALRAQHEAVTLDQTHNEMFAGLLISINAFASSLGRPAGDEWVPPLEWLEVSHGSYALFPSKEKVLADSDLSICFEITKPIWGFSQGEVPEEFQPILDSNLMDDDGSAVEVYEVCRKCLLYIGKLQTAIRSNETPFSHLRRINMFPMLTPRRFADLLRNREPRALLVLACFYAVIQESKALGYFGRLDRVVEALCNEIIAIYHALPLEWKHLVPEILNATGVSLAGSYVSHPYGVTGQLVTVANAEPAAVGLSESIESPRSVPKGWASGTLQCYVEDFRAC